MKAILILGAVLLALGALLRLVRLGALAEYSIPESRNGPAERLGNRPEGRKNGRNARSRSWAAGRWRW